MRKDQPENWAPRVPLFKVIGTESNLHIGLRVLVLLTSSDGILGPIRMPMPFDLERPKSVQCRSSSNQES